MSLSETQLLGMSTSGRLCVISPVLTPEQSIGESSWNTEWCRGAVLPTYTGHEDHGWQRMGLGGEGKEGRRNSLRSVVLQPSAPVAVALSCGSEADSCMWDPSRPEWCVAALGCPRVTHQVLFFKGPLGLFLTPLQGPAAQIQAITNPS